MSKEIHIFGQGDEIPDPRRTEQEQRKKQKRDKEEERKAKRGIGLFREPAVTARHKHAGDPIKQIAYLFSDRNIPAALGRYRFVGDRRFEEMQDRLIEFVKKLPELRCPIQNITELNIKHVLALARWWEQQGLAEGTIQNYLSIFRRFFALMGKPGLVPKREKLKELLHSHGLVAGTLNRQYVPELALGWRDQGFDPEALIEAVRKESGEVFACILEICLAFGLRESEAVHLRPSESDLAGQGLAVFRGTKGGKPRLVKYFTDPEKAKYQREVLDRAKAVAAKHHRGELAVPGLTLKQMKNLLTWVLRRHFIYKNGLGITLHGLRHQFACDLFTDLTGMPAPVLGVLPASEYEKRAEEVHAAMLEVSRQLGHERKSISAAYIGSAGKLDKTQRARINQWLKKLEPAAQAFRDAGAIEAWMVDVCGRGGYLRPEDSMKLAVRFDAELSMRTAACILNELQAAIQSAAGLKVVAVAWTNDAPPNDGAEILFHRESGV